MNNHKELLTLRLPTEINQKFSKIVSSLGISKNAFVLSLIHKEIKKAEKNNLDNKNNLH